MCRERIVNRGSPAAQPTQTAALPTAQNAAHEPNAVAGSDVAIDAGQEAQPSIAAATSRPLARGQRIAANHRFARPPAPMTRSRAASAVQRIVEEQTADRRVTRQMSRQMQLDAQRTNRN